MAISPAPWAHPGPSAPRCVSAWPSPDARPPRRPRAAGRRAAAARPGRSQRSANVVGDRPHRTLPWNGFVHQITTMNWEIHMGI